MCTFKPVTTGNTDGKLTLYKIIHIMFVRHDHYCVSFIGIHLRPKTHITLTGEVNSVGYNCLLFALI